MLVPNVHQLCMLAWCVSTAWCLRAKVNSVSTHVDFIKLGCTSWSQMETVTCTDGPQALKTTSLVGACKHGYNGVLQHVAVEAS